MTQGELQQEIEIIYNPIGEIDRSKVTYWKGNAVWHIQCHTA